MRPRERVAAAALEGRDALDTRAHLFGRAVAAGVGRLDVRVVTAGAARELSKIAFPGCERRDAVAPHGRARNHELLGPCLELARAARRSRLPPRQQRVALAQGRGITNEVVARARFQAQ